MALLPLNPQRVALVDLRTGLIEVPWLRLLEQLQDGTAQTTDITALQASIAALQAQVNGLTLIVADIVAATAVEGTPPTVLPEDPDDQAPPFTAEEADDQAPPFAAEDVDDQAPPFAAEDVDDQAPPDVGCCAEDDPSGQLEALAARVDELEQIVDSMRDAPLPSPPT